MTRFNIFAISLFAFVLSACASTHKGRAMQVVVASDGVADEMATQWDEQAHARIDKCRAEGHATAEDRTECMGVFAKIKDEVDAALAALVAAQMAIKLAVECESNPLKMPDEFLDRCVKDKKADWKALEAQVMEAWDTIRPLFQEIKEGKNK